LIAACSNSSSSGGPFSLTAQSCDGLLKHNEWIVKYANQAELERVHSLVPSPLRPIEKIYANYRIPVPRPVNRIQITLEEIYHVDKYMKVIGAETAWSKGYFGKNIVVAVIDSGVDVFHPRLKDAIDLNMADTENNFDDDANGFIDDHYGWNFTTDSNQVVDETGHGTHIAGIIAASHNSSYARGIAPLARILPVDFVAGESGDEFAAMLAIRYAMIRGAHIINNSWSAYCSDFLREAFEEWKTHDVIFVNSSGNDGADITHVAIYPANIHHSNHVTVGAFDRLLDRAPFSNYGDIVSVLAPGDMVLSLGVHERDTMLDAGEELVFRTGTSMSTAFVSGTLALGWSKRPDLHASRVVEVFRQVHKPLSAGGDPRILNIPAFLKALEKAP